MARQKHTIDHTSSGDAPSQPAEPRPQRTLMTLNQWASANGIPYSQARDRFYNKTLPVFAVRINGAKILVDPSRPPGDDHFDVVIRTSPIKGTIDWVTALAGMYKELWKAGIRHEYNRHNGMEKRLQQVADVITDLSLRQLARDKELGELLAGDGLELIGHDARDQKTPARNKEVMGELFRIEAALTEERRRVEQVTEQKEGVAKDLIESKQWLAGKDRELAAVKQELDASKKESSQLRSRVQDLEIPAPPTPEEYYHGSQSEYIAVRDAIIGEELTKRGYTNGGAEWRKLEREVIERIKDYTLPENIRKTVDAIILEKHLPKPPPPESIRTGKHRENCW